MPEIFKEDVKEETKPQDPQASQVLTDLFKLTKPTAIPWRDGYVTKTLRECYNFVEGRHWEESDIGQLGLDDVPALSIDRISRVKDTVNGIRTNTGNKKKIVKRELGDERIAELLDLTYDFFEYQGNWNEVFNDSFNNLLDAGIGVMKVLFDPSEEGGEGTILAENVNIEDFGCSKCKSKTLSDITWAWHKQNMSWEEAILLAPEKAGEIKGLKTTLISEWEKLKGGTTANLTTRDYAGNVPQLNSDAPYGYPDEVCIYEFWVKRNIPYKKIGFLGSQTVSSPIDGSPVQIPVPQVREEPADYQVQEGEQDLTTSVHIEWHQFVVASGQGENSAIFLKENVDKDHPFIGVCAERKKSGQPVGLVEKIIPHQKRIDIAWAQKVSFNNHAIKSPLIADEGAFDEESAKRASKTGVILYLQNGKKIHQTNQSLNLNLQAIEEGNSARKDMDFLAAATEPVLRGEAESGSSGIRLSQQQSAAVTPINKWVNAEGDAKREFARKVLRYIVQYVKPERMARIVGVKKMWELMTPKLDPITGQVVEPPLQLPINPDVTQYDVVIQDQALSDFNKQQTFNAVMAMRGGGIPLDDTFVIKSAPIKNVDEALISNQKARNDLLMQAMQQIQILQEQVGQLGKQVPKTTNQQANAQTGRNAGQAGKRSMTGGQTK